MKRKLLSSSDYILVKRNGYNEIVFLSDLWKGALLTKYSCRKLRGSELLLSLKIRFSTKEKTSLKKDGEDANV